MTVDAEAVLAAYRQRAAAALEAQLYDAAIMETLAADTQRRCAELEQRVDELAARVEGGDS